MRLLGGRDVQPTDRFAAPRLLLVNEAFVQRHWPDGRALNHRILGGVTLALVGAAPAASLAPARRATRIDPLVALRNE